MAFHCFFAANAVKGKSKQGGGYFGTELHALLREREKKEPQGARQTRYIGFSFHCRTAFEGGAGLPYPTNALGGR